MSLAEAAKEIAKDVIELTALRAELDELISGLEYILTMDRTKGYPTGVEWGILVSRIKGFLSKHPKRGE